MSKTLLLRNIGTLAGIQPQGVTRLQGHDLKSLSTLKNAYLFAENGLIVQFGPDHQCPVDRADEIIDCKDRIVFPAYCDSHTHLVFAAWRDNEFVDKINGLTYEEIASRGGGILNSAAKLQVMEEELLFEQAHIRLEELIDMGTGAIEIKSGYGLTTDAELKMLRVVRRLKELNKIPVRATFLGAHAYPAAFRNDHDGYIKLIIEDMLPRIEHEGLADYIDVFCEENFFSPDESSRVLEAGQKRGLKVKVHANELAFSGGIQLGVKHKAISVDHLEYTGPAEIEALQDGNTIATLLPSTAFFLGLPYAPARSMIDNDLCVALASDFNPGTSPSGNMSFVMSLACIKLKMLPEEALQAATLNGAAAMDLSHEMGSVTIGKKASLIITRKMERISELPYLFGHKGVWKVVN